MKKFLRPKFLLAVIAIVSILVVFIVLRLISDQNEMTVQTSELDMKNLRSSYLMKFQPHHFIIKDGFTLPMSKLTHPIHSLITKQWMEDLRNYLFKIPPNSTASPISIASSDSNFENVLLNWLISAIVNIHPPISHVLILSLDQPLHQRLLAHGFDSVYVDAKDLFQSHVLKKIQDSGRLAFYVVMVLRLTVMRLLTHWGYDAANYDTDAIILRNPERLYYGDFNGSALIGSRGRFPESVKEVLGLTLCAGVFMIKSTPQTEKFWRFVSAAEKNKCDDQTKLNIALTKMDLKSNDVAFADDETWMGQNRDGFAVAILKFTHMCRKTCTKKQKGRYYVWHHGGKFIEGKLERARKDGVWYLKEDWKKLAQQNSSVVGVQWLQDLKAET